jgi:hypothetical protein
VLVIVLFDRSVLVIVHLSLYYICYLLYDVMLVILYMNVIVLLNIWGVKCQ